MIGLVMLLSRVTSPSDHNWIILGREAGVIVSAINGLRVSIFSIPFRILTYHQALYNLDMVDEYHPPAQMWLKFLNMYQFTLQYCKGTDNNNTGFPSHLPMDATESRAHGSSRITHGGNTDVYFVGRPLTSSRVHRVHFGPPGPVRSYSFGVSSNPGSGH